ncbi:CRISPR-associated protein [Spirosomataceae bacterium TFI 002]|nr:CRISPR-associated protein [Spirosomataceae bacterium TFI 002]
MKTLNLTYKNGNWYYKGLIDGKDEKVFLDNFRAGNEELIKVLNKESITIEYLGREDNRNPNRLFISKFKHKGKEYSFSRQSTGPARGNYQQRRPTNVETNFGRSPYNFVPLPPMPKPSQDQVTDFSSYQTEKHTGYLDFEIQNLGPIHTGDNSHLFTRIAGKPAINGSTSRGLIRACLESIAYSNFIHFNNKSIYRRAEGDKVYEDRIQGWLQYDKENDAFVIKEVNSVPTEKPTKILKKSSIQYLDKYALVQIKGVNYKSHAQIKFDYPIKPLEVFPIKEEVINLYKNDEDRSFEMFETGKFTNLLEKAKNSPKYGVPVWFEVTTPSNTIPHFGHCINYRVPTGKVSDALPQAFKTNTDSDLVQCLFGEDVELNGKAIQRAGKVFFEDAYIDDKAPEFSKRLLQILSRPRVTFAKNYLESNGHRNISWFDSTIKLRGYKHYQHIITNAWEKDEIEKKEYDKLLGYDKKACQAITNSEHLFFDGNETKPIKSLSDIDKTLAEKLFKAINADEKSQFKAVEVLDSKHTFTSRVRFENLSDIELGALLFVFNLPDNMAHKLGMGKPLGLGSTKINMEKLTLIDRKKRYNSLFDSNENWNLGEIDSNELTKLANNANAAFSNFMIAKSSARDIWQLPHMKELAAMLTYDNKHNASDDWKEKTRYPKLTNDSVKEFKTFEPLLPPTKFKNA